ncbi:MAG: hypothetical protein M3R14_01850 [Acidobacteriota bacterium]|nr:hypothetical protein [Acidobacteriota bacterium]
MGAIDAVKQTQPVNYQKTSEPVNKPAKDVGTSDNSPVVFRTKVYERDFAAQYTIAKLNFWRDPDKPSPTPQTPNLTSSGSGTDTTYRIGDPTRPNIQHDNGFLQNPNDPNDPNPIPTVEPSQSDIDFYNDQLSQVTWAQRVDNFNIPFRDEDDKARRLEDGIEAYRHFLEGNGADRNFSYDEFVSEDPSGQAILDNAIADTQRGAEDLYNQMIADDPSLAGQTITFDVTSGVITVGGTDGYPYPETENWRKAIGGHPIWNSATVTVTPPSEAGGKPEFSMEYTLHAEDRYNFNPEQADIDTGVPDDVRGVQLEQTGLAHQYTQYATLNRDVSWTQGDISGTTETDDPNEGR